MQLIFLDIMTQHRWVLIFVVIIFLRISFVVGNLVIVLSLMCISISLYSFPHYILFEYKSSTFYHSKTCYFWCNAFILFKTTKSSKVNSNITSVITFRILISTKTFFSTIQQTGTCHGFKKFLIGYFFLLTHMKISLYFSLKICFYCIS